MGWGGTHRETRDFQAEQRREGPAPLGELPDPSSCSSLRTPAGSIAVPGGGGMPLLRPRGCPGGVRGSCSHAGTAGHKAGVHPLSTSRFACTGPALAAPAAPPPVLPSPAQRRNLQAASPTWGEDEPLSVAFWESCGVAAAQGPQTRRGAKGRAGGGGDTGRLSRL